MTLLNFRILIIQSMNTYRVPCALRCIAYVYEVVFIISEMEIDGTGDCSELKKRKCDFDTEERSKNHVLHKLEDSDNLSDSKALTDNSNAQLESYGVGESLQTAQTSSCSNSNELGMVPTCSSVETPNCLNAEQTLENASKDSGSILIPFDKDRGITEQLLSVEGKDTKSEEEIFSQSGRPLRSKYM